MSNKPFFAMIIPMGDTPGGGGGPPPSVWHPTFPTNPIVVPPGGSYPGQPPTIWPGPNPPYVDAGFPGPQPGGPTHIWGGPWYPPTIWPGPKPPYIDAGFPGPQPGHPPGIWGGPWYPPVIWDPARPTNPIVNPGDPNHPGAGQPDRTPKIEWKTAWSPSTGWIVVGVPTGEHVTPSAEGEQPK